MSQEDYLKDIDGAVMLELLPQKISMAKRVVADSALDLAAAEGNPDATPTDIEQILKGYRARKYQLTQFEAMLERFQKAARGE